MYADSPETKILKSGRGKPYVAVLLSEQFRVLVKAMLEFIIQKSKSYCEKWVYEEQR